MKVTMETADESNSCNETKEIYDESVEVKISRRDTGQYLINHLLKLYTIFRLFTVMSCLVSPPQMGNMLTIFPHDGQHDDVTAKLTSDR